MFKKLNRHWTLANSPQQKSELFAQSLLCHSWILFFCCEMMMKGVDQNTRDHIFSNITESHQHYLEKLWSSKIQERFSLQNRVLKTLHFQNKTGYGFSKKIKAWELWHRYHSLALLLYVPPQTTEIRKLLYFLEGWVSWSAEKKESHFNLNIDRQGSSFCLMCSGFTSINIFEYKSKVFKDFIGLEGELKVSDRVF